MWVVAFTTKGLAKCRIVAQETADFIDPERVLSWSVDPYMRNVLVDGFPGSVEALDTSFVPTGHFETIDQFAYVFSVNDTVYLYVEYLSGNNGIRWVHQTLMLPTDDIKVYFRYVAPTVTHQDLPSMVSVISPTDTEFLS